MSARQLILIPTLLLILLATGCARVHTSIRQKDGTYREYDRLILRTPTSDFRTFNCTEDYMVATRHYGVTYGWPEGKGAYSDNFAEITFRGDDLECTVVYRTLTVNGETYGEFKEGDEVRITPDGKVLVNEKKDSDT